MKYRTRTEQEEEDTEAKLSRETCQERIVFIEMWMYKNVEERDMVAFSRKQTKQFLQRGCEKWNKDWNWKKNHYLRCKGFLIEQESCVFVVR